VQPEKHCALPVPQYFQDRALNGRNQPAAERHGVPLPLELSKPFFEQPKGNRMTQLTDSPPLEPRVETHQSWDDLERTRFYRPVKHSITLRVDADVLDWFKTNSDKYQSRINQILRETMKREREARGAK
jgi:uncharacterized protein (DUF4415 family)